MANRTFTQEFKLAIVRQLACGEKRPAQVCREYGLCESVLSRWRKAYAERGETAFAPPAAADSQASTAEAHIAELERFCGRLALENAVLKKALQSLQAAQSEPGTPRRSVTS